jgi:type 1 fimbriae regulatory protein FimB
MSTAPVLQIRTPANPRAHRSTRSFLSPAELLAVLKTARARSTRDWAMVLVSYRHGLRASEICGLKLSDVNLREGSIAIRRLKGSMNQVQPLYRHKGQPLLDEVGALRAWIRDRADDGSGILFLSQKGGALHRSSFFSIFAGLATDAGLPPEKRHPHVLKHTLASHLVAGNVNLALVKMCLGHKSINSTMQYVGTSDAQAAEAAQTALMGLF